jgi:hypothetical protein
MQRSDLRRFIRAAEYCGCEMHGQRAELPHLGREDYDLTKIPFDSEEERESALSTPCEKPQLKIGGASLAGTLSGSRAEPQGFCS